MAARWEVRGGLGGLCGFSADRCNRFHTDVGIDSTSCSWRRGGRFAAGRFRGGLGGSRRGSQTAARREVRGGLGGLRGLIGRAVWRGQSTLRT
jgi:hypothetical protein